MKKYNIGVFVDTWYPVVDGVIKVVENYCNRLSQNNFNVYLFCPKPRDTKYEEKKYLFNIKRSKRLKVFFLSYDLALPNMDKEFLDYIDKLDLDLVHIHSPFTMGKLGVKVAKKKNIPVVGTIHSQYRMDFLSASRSYLITSIMTRSVLNVLNKTNVNYTVNEALSELYYKGRGYGLKKKPQIIPNATDFKYFDNKDEIISLKNKYQIKDNEKVFLYVGRIYKLKNLEFLTKSLGILKKNNFKFKMFFIGEGDHEKLLDKWILENNIEKETIKIKGIYDRVELSKYFNMADLFLFPSTYDTNSLVQIEAASQKTPTVFLRKARTSSTVTEDVNGYKTDDTPIAYANKIIEIFKDMNKYNEIKENCYKDLYKTWDEVYLILENEYLKLINNHQNSCQYKMLDSKTKKMYN